MAAGDLTATHLVTAPASAQTTIKAAIDAENLAAATDQIVMCAVPGRNAHVSVWKIERAAA